jgi:hypothetical protein
MVLTTFACFLPKPQGSSLFVRSPSKRFIQWTVEMYVAVKDHDRTPIKMFNFLVPALMRAVREQLSCFTSPTMLITVVDVLKN